MNKRVLYWLLTLSVFSALFIPWLIQDGMFLDGITYSAISKNMANGIGSFFNPQYTKTLYAGFYEHPPLVFIIQSFFFKVFGNDFYTERIYCLFIAIVTVFGIVLCWKMFTDDSLNKYDWLPVFLWLMVPLVSWSYRNNLLENTMGVFTIFSVYFILKSFKKNKIAYLIPAGFAIFAAFLCKGFTGLFPLAVPLLYRVVSKKNTLRYFIFLSVFTFFTAFLILLIFPALRENLVIYLNHQVIPSLNNQREITTNYRLHIMVNLLFEIIIPVLIVAFFFILKWFRHKNLGFSNSKLSLLFFFTGIAASFPLIITMKQRSFYLIPSIPFYILSLSLAAAPVIASFLDKINSLNQKILLGLSLMIFLFVILFSVFHFGKFSRDADKLKDVYTISGVVKEGAVIGASAELCGDWNLIAYLSRIGNISLDCNKDCDFLLLRKDSAIDSETSDKYQITNVILLNYVLLKK